MVIKLCRTCNKIFKSKLCAKRKFCSRSCYFKYWIPWNKGTKGLIKPNSGSFKKGQFDGDKHPFWKGGRIKHSQGYILIYAPDHPNQYNNHILEHRLVMEKEIGRILKKSELIHHKNGIKTDNRPQNLELINRRQHPKIHFTGVPTRLRKRF